MILPPLVFPGLSKLPQALPFGGMEEKKNLVPVFIVSTLVRLSDVRREEKAKEVSAGTCWTLLVAPSSSKYNNRYQLIKVFTAD